MEHFGAWGRLDDQGTPDMHDCYKRRLKGLANAFDKVRLVAKEIYHYSLPHEFSGCEAIIKECQETWAVLGDMLHD